MPTVRAAAMARLLRHAEKFTCQGIFNIPGHDTATQSTP